MAYVERIEPDQEEWKQWIGIHLHRYRFASQFVAGKRVLDAGCGVGYGTRVLIEAGASEIVAADVSEAALMSAERLFSHPRVRFVRDNCETLQAVSGPFDAIVALESLEHFQDVPAFLKQVRRLLARNGVFICSTPNGLATLPNGTKRPLNPFHVREYSPKEFYELLNRHFENIAVTGQHETSAYVLATRISMNPLIRLGWLAQRLHGGRIPWRVPHLSATEGDYVMSEANLEKAGVLLAVCREPKLITCQRGPAANQVEQAADLPGTSVSHV